MKMIENDWLQMIASVATLMANKIHDMAVENHVHRHLHMDVHPSKGPKCTALHIEPYSTPRALTASPTFDLWAGSVPSYMGQYKWEMDSFSSIQLWEEACNKNVCVCVWVCVCVCS